MDMEEAQSPSAGGDAETVQVESNDDGIADSAIGRKVTPLSLKIDELGQSDNIDKPLDVEGTTLGTEEENTQRVTDKDIPGLDAQGELQNSAEKSSLYQKGDELLRTGHTDEALMCFLASLKGLKESNTFQELPQCLHQISDIYFSKNEYEKAVYFIQAEKMYYETALIDILTFQQQVANKRKLKEETQEGDIKETEEEVKDDGIQEEVVNSPEVAKANEFENLANLCLREGKLQLAMEYCGKATKLFRESLGDDHPRTIKSLDLFTCIYADVGKKLYEDAMQRFDADKREKQDSSETSSGETSAVRKRRKKRVTFSEDTRVEDSEPDQNIQLEPTPPPQEQDDWVVTCLLMVVFFLVTVLITLIGSYLYCRNNSQSSPFCAELRGDVTYWYMKMRHLFHYYVRGSR